VRDLVAGHRAVADEMVGSAFSTRLTTGRAILIETSWNSFFTA
jgi:hypothetical protein